MNKEQLQRVRDALFESAKYYRPESFKEAVTILDAELAKPEPEVAWDHPVAIAYRKELAELTQRNYELRHTAPPAAKQWVGLTDEEMTHVTFKTNKDYGTIGWLMDFGRALQSALKEKNHG